MRKGVIFRLIDQTTRNKTCLRNPLPESTTKPNASLAIMAHAYRSKIIMMMMMMMVPHKTVVLIPLEATAMPNAVTPTVEETTTVSSRFPTIVLCLEFVESGRKQ
jgi:hypothetical protein